MGGKQQEEVSLEAAKRGLYKEIHPFLEFWHGRGWRIVKQGHKFALWPPNPGFRMMPPWVRVDGTPRGDPGYAAKAVDRRCWAMQRLIDEHDDCD